LSQIRVGQSCALDTRQAAEDFFRDVEQTEMSLVVFFCSSDHDLAMLAQTFNRLFAGVPVIGSTSAGGCYGPEGYQPHSLSGVSFSSSDTVAVTALMQVSPSFDTAAARDSLSTMRSTLEHKASWARSVNTFALQLIDGLCGQEEVVSRTLQNALGAINLVGGSAGDGLQFLKTQVFCDGAFHSNHVALAVIATRLPFYLFKTQHFSPLEERMVVTRADAAQRIVHELNGLPAASEYARCAGVDVGQLNFEFFSTTPVVVKFGGKPFIRSIQKVLPDGALKFYCAIEEGVVLHLGQANDLVQDLNDLSATIETEVGGPAQLTIGCDCVLRRMAIEQRQLDATVAPILKAQKMVGFVTYGEQYRGAHINQTMTGVAFGASHREQT
jgi:hypothetical protein